jgi:hypothetical protein
MIDTDRLELIDTGDGIPLTKCEQNLYEALANVRDGWYYEDDESVNHACRDNTFVRLEDALADMSELVAEVKRLHKIEQEHGRVTIDDWEHKSLGDADAHPEYGRPYVTVYHGGCEYVGLLRLYKNEDGEVIELLYELRRNILLQEMKK